MASDGALFQLLLCLLLLLCSLTPAPVAAVSSAVPSALKHVNTSNSHSFLSHSKFLLNFYAPWCAHCQNFAGSYNNIASILSAPPHQMLVGSCDSQANPALAARFDVFSIPSIYLYREGNMWKYDGALLREPIIEWATNGYKKKTPLSLLTSPMGLMGTSKGTLIRIGDSLQQALPFLTDRMGLPRWTGFLIVALALGFTILVAILVIVFVSVKIKLD